MNDRQSYSSLEASYLAEGTRNTSEAAEPISHFRMETVLVVHSGYGVKDCSGEEGLISQVGVVLEGRDDTDAQDATLKTDDGRPQRNSQTVQYGSSN